MFLLFDDDERHFVDYHARPQRVVTCVAIPWWVQDVPRIAFLGNSEQNKNHVFCFACRGRDRSPILDIENGPLAQLVEQLTLNQLVVGSIPTRPTNLSLDDDKSSSRERFILLAPVWAHLRSDSVRPISISIKRFILLVSSGHTYRSVSVPLLGAIDCLRKFAQTVS
jgi:hypothetical protein